jgi:hypothetical protein
MERRATSIPSAATSRWQFRARWRCRSRATTRRDRYPALARAFRGKHPTVILAVPKFIERMKDEVVLRAESTPSNQRSCDEDRELLQHSRECPGSAREMTQAAVPDRERDRLVQQRAADRCGGDVVARCSGGAAARCGGGAAARCSRGAAARCGGGAAARCGGGAAARCGEGAAARCGEGAAARCGEGAAARCGEGAAVFHRRNSFAKPRDRYPLRRRGPCSSASPGVPCRTGFRNMDPPWIRTA